MVLEEEQGFISSKTTNTTTNTTTAMLPASPRKAKVLQKMTKLLTDLDWKILLLICSILSLVIFLFLSSPTSSFPSPFPFFTFSSSPPTHNHKPLPKGRIAVCLVGGARRFELTGPSILDRVLGELGDNNTDLFVNSPFDSNSFKFSLLKEVKRVAGVRVFKPKPIVETDAQERVLTSANSPNGIQGLLQYFNLVEGCLTMIQAYQKEQNFTYDWIVRTRVDGYWSAPLDPDSFIPGRYVVPSGSSFGGLNDRLGIGDYNTSVVALSRLSLVPILDSLNFTGLNSETAFKAQLTSNNISYNAIAQPFCIVSDRQYSFPPARFGVPVASLSSEGPLNGVKCRPCKPVCKDSCVNDVMSGLYKGWSWTPWKNGTLELCDGSGEWEEGWEKIFDRAAGKKLALPRKKVRYLDVKQCIEDFEEIQRKATHWDTPPLEEMCKLGLDTTK